MKFWSANESIVENGSASSRVPVRRLSATAAKASKIFVATSRNSREERGTAVGSLFFILRLAVLHPGHVGRDPPVPRQEDPFLRRRLQTLRDVHENGQVGSTDYTDQQIGKTLKVQILLRCPLRICRDATLWIRVDTRHANPLSLREFRKLLPWLGERTKSLAIQGRRKF